MKFLDQAKIFIKSGDGGAGCVGFRREKFIEFGGPNGGDGGRGGHVYIQAINNLNTLIDFRYQQHFKAPKGDHGMGKSRTGPSGKHLIIKVPVGTQVFAEDKESLIVDMMDRNQVFLLAQGGDGGRGNIHFKSSTNQTPRNAEPGWPGEELWVWLQLKLIADVGLVGLPNAGKSTFLAACTAAKPKIASYPFTTLWPQLGVVSQGTGEFVLADIPGLIEGAHAGQGLGDRFLAHIERCAVLMHVVDVTSSHIEKDWQTVRHELKAYDQALSNKPIFTILNKIDAVSSEESLAAKTLLQQLTSEPIFMVSAAGHQGVDIALQQCWEIVEDKRSQQKESTKQLEYHPLNC